MQSAQSSGPSILFFWLQPGRLRAALAEREAQLGDLQDQHMRLVVSHSPMQMMSAINLCGLMAAWSVSGWAALDSAPAPACSNACLP